MGRFTPSADGKTLQARFTADDPVILAKPFGKCDPRDLGNSAH